MSCSPSKTSVVQFVEDTMESLKPNCVSIMIISRGLLGAFYAHIATEDLLVDIVVQADRISSDPLSNILTDPIQDG
jgi:hypothetical protein